MIRITFRTHRKTTVFILARGNNPIWNCSVVAPFAYFKVAYLAYHVSFWSTAIITHFQAIIAYASAANVAQPRLQNYSFLLSQINIPSLLFEKGEPHILFSILEPFLWIRIHCKDSEPQQHRIHRNIICSLVNSIS